MAKTQEYGSRFLYAEDLIKDGEYRTVTVEVGEYHPPNTIKAANGKSVDKHCIGFRGHGKLLALCKTNASIGVYVTGQQIGESWVGKSITLQVRMVEAFGETVPAIRIVPAPGTLIRKSLKARLGTKAELARG